MPELQVQGLLSARAQRASAAEAKSLILDVLANLWEPTTNPGGFVNVGLAENVLMHDILLERINKSLNLPARYLTYNDGGAGSTRLKNAIACFLNRHFAPVSSIQWNQVVVTNGVSSAIEHLSWALVSPGHGILLGRPYYGQFIPDIEMRPETTVVPVDFHGRDPLGSAAVAEYEKALLRFQNQTGRRVGAILVCHPHNPLGRCYPTEIIVGLMMLCQKHRVHL